MNGFIAALANTNKVSMDALAMLRDWLIFESEGLLMFLTVK